MPLPSEMLYDQGSSSALVFLGCFFLAQNPGNYIVRGVGCKAKRTLASKMPAFAEADPVETEPPRNTRLRLILTDEDREQD
jgi:hypothetical protein